MSCGGVPRFPTRPLAARNVTQDLEEKNNQPPGRARHTAADERARGAGGPRPSPAERASYAVARRVGNEPEPATLSALDRQMDLSFERRLGLRSFVVAADSHAPSASIRCQDLFPTLTHEP